MKKLFLSLSVLASLLVAGCSGDDAVSGNETDGDFTTHYMYVNIMSADGSETRADGGPYEYGTDDENKVEAVRFYFFTENGAAVNVHRTTDGYVNYYDWTPVTEEDTETENKTGSNNVAKILHAKIVINSKEGDKLPRAMVAVLNPTSTLKNQSLQGLTTLRSFSNDYAHTDLTKAGKFVMSNSVYGDPDTTPIEEVCAVYIENKNICTTEEAAKNEPVYMYVERNVAKVGVFLGTDLVDANNRIALKDKDNKDIKVGEGNSEQQVYLQLEGWALTAETDKGYLIKRVNTDWNSKWWNEGEYRCSWAMNAKGAKNKWLRNYNDINNAFGTYAYTNENAAPFSDGSSTTTLAHTKFIIKGKLCKQDGTALTLVRHWGNLFADTYSSTENDNLPELKKSVLSYLVTNGKYYFKKDLTATPESNTLAQIASKDIVIKTDTQVEEEDSKKNCFVHAELATDAADDTKTKWYIFTPTETSEDATIPATVTINTTTNEDGTTSLTTENGTIKETTSEAINSDLQDKETEETPMVWRDGQTYFYSEIIHRNFNETTPETPGVVRNHVYKATITEIAGLGTPVYDPSLIIYPEKPNPDDHYIAAKINILAWRIISQDYQLKW